jgi:hypothetical protein
MVASTSRYTLAAFAAVLLVGSGSFSPPASGEPRRAALDIETGHVVLEVVGQVNNLGPSPDAPLGSSRQFGYVSHLEGVDSVFTDPDPAKQNETTAMLTFFTDVKTTRVTPHGPFSIVLREGTTTFFRNSVPASFSTPDSFQAGDAILSSTIRQQVILDTVERTFTVVNLNTITRTKSFDLGQESVRIGAPGDMIRTSLMGVLRARDGVPPPTGHFAGSGVGIARHRGESQ